MSVSTCVGTLKMPVAIAISKRLDCDMSNYHDVNFSYPGDTLEDYLERELEAAFKYEMACKDADDNYQAMMEARDGTD